MAASTRLLSALALLSATLGAIHFTWPSWPDHLLSGKPVPRPGLRVLVPRDRQLEVLSARIEAKRQVVRRLVAGELTLVEAAGWFRYLNRTPEDLPARGVRLIEGRCEGEQLCLQVIRWAESELAGAAGAGEEDARLRALQAELADHIARHGRVVLPEP